MIGRSERTECSDQIIREHMKLSIEKKLHWLEEVVDLMNNTLTEKEREFRRRLRDGSL